MSAFSLDSSLPVSNRSSALRVRRPVGHAHRREAREVRRAPTTGPWCPWLGTAAQLARLVAVARRSRGFGHDRGSASRQASRLAAAGGRDLATTVGPWPRPRSGRARCRHRAVDGGVGGQHDTNDDWRRCSVLGAGVAVATARTGRVAVAMAPARTSAPLTLRPAARMRPPAAAWVRRGLGSRRSDEGDARCRRSGLSAERAGRLWSRRAALPGRQDGRRWVSHPAHRPWSALSSRPLRAGSCVVAPLSWPPLSWVRPSGATVVGAPSRGAAVVAATAGRAGGRVDVDGDLLRRRCVG